MMGTKNRTSTKTRRLACTIGGFAILIGACRDPVVKPIRSYRNKTAAYYTAEGGVVLWNQDGTKYCVAPPAAGARTTDSDTKGELSGAVGSEVTLGVSGEVSVDRRVESIFDQGQGNLFLQFALYRLCEMELNGTIDAEQYQELFGKVLDLAGEIVRQETELEEKTRQRLELELQRIKLGQ